MACDGPGDLDARTPQADSAAVPGPPAGARPLSADEAADLLARGDHPDVTAGALAFGAVLVDAIRTGLVAACRLADGRLAFTRTA